VLLFIANTDSFIYTSPLRHQVCLTFLDNCTGAVTGTNPRVSAGIPRERERILRKTRGNDGNGNDFCGNTAGTGPNFTWNTANIISVHCDSKSLHLIDLHVFTVYRDI